MKYGIKLTLPEGDPLRQAHLLGQDWESFRWYASAEERDAALGAMQQRVPYYRVGDTPSMVMSKIDR